VAIGDDNIRIGVSPDLSGFNRELDAKLRALSGFEIRINGKPVLTNFRSQLNKEIAKVEKSKSAEVKVTPTVNKTEVKKFKSELNRQLASGGKTAINLTITKSETTALRRQIQKQVFDKPFTVKAEMTKTSLKALQKSLQIPLELKLPSQAEINLLRGRIQQRFGAIQVQVNARSGPISNVGSGVAKGAAAEVDKLSYSHRNLARDMTLVGRAATQSKATLFSFLGAISPGQVALTAFSTALIGGTRAFIKFGIESSKSIQQTRLALFGFLNGNRPLINAFIQQMQDFSAVTPFSLESVLKTSKLLLGAGQNVTRILPELQAIGGLGAQLGVSSDAISRVGTAIAKIAGQGKVTSRELRSIFTAFPGFQPIKALADNLEGFGGSTQRVLKAMSKGAVNANAAIDALIKGMLQFPGAADALYRQSLLLAGSQETLQDRFEQVARSAVGAALPQLASNYRKAAEIFNQQSKTSLGFGIRQLIRDGSDLIPIFAKGLVPVVDKFAGALASLIPPFKQFINDFGSAFFEAFQAALLLVPALANNLGLLFTVIKPFAPVIETFAKVLNLIPAPLISIAAALKLFGNAGVFGGLFGRGGSESAGFVSKQVADIGRGVKNIGDYSKGTGSALKNAFNSAGVAQLDRRVQSLQTSIRNVNLESTRNKGFFGGLPGIVQLQNYKKELAAVEARGVTTGQKLVGSFNAAGSAMKSAASSMVGALGGPVGIAITAATVGVSLLISNFQKAKAEANQVKKEVRLIGAELSLDSSAITGAERLAEIMFKIANETERGKKAFEFFKDRGVGESAITSVTGDPEKYKEALSLLKSQAGSQYGDSINAQANRVVSGFFGFDDAATEAEKRATNLETIYNEYLMSSKEAVAEELRIATDLKDKGLIAKFKQAQKDLEAGKDPAKVYDNIRDSVNELSIKQNNLNSSAIKAALSNKELSKSMLGSADAVQAANDAVDSLNTALNELILNQDNVSAETAKKLIGQPTFGAYSEQFAALGNDPEGQMAFLKEINAEFLEFTNDPAAAQALTAQIAGWKNIVLTGLADFKEAFVKNLPNMATIFAEQFDLTNKGPGLSEITSRMRKSTEYILKFQKNLNILYKAGFEETAALFAEQGPAQAGKALDEAVASIGRDGKSKALTSLEISLGEYESAILGSGDAISRVAAVAVGKQFNISPDLIVTPEVKEMTPEALESAALRVQTDIDKIAKRRKEIAAENVRRRKLGEKPKSIEERLKEDPLYAELYPTAPTATELEQIANAYTVVEDEIRKKILKNKAARKRARQDGSKQPTLEADPEYQSLVDEQARLAKVLEKTKNDIFTNIKTGATETSTAVTKTFEQTDISGAMKPEIDKAKGQIASIASGEDSLGSQIASQFGPTLLNAKGKSAAPFKASGAFDIKAILGDTLTKTATSAGKAAGDAMASAFKQSFKTGAQMTEAEAKLLSTGILKPFRTARTGINSLITALTAMGTSLGVPISIKQIPEFHTGGIVGDRGAKMHSGSVKEKEQLAVLLKGEAVLPHKTVNQMSPEMIKSLVKGDVDGFVPQYLKSKATGGSKNTPSQEASSSFESTPWIAQFDGIRRSIDAQMAQTKRQLVTLAFETFDAAHGMSVKYAKRFDPPPGQFGSVASVAALTGSMKEIAAQMAAVKGKNNNYKTLIAFMKATGIPFDVSSTVRPGSITNSGNKSYHGFGRAVDFTGRKYGNDTKELYDIFKGFGPVEGLLAELIYAGPQAKYNIKNGKRVGKYAVKDHHNHVHAALYNGGLVKGSPEGIIANIGERGQSEVVLPMNNPARIMDITTQAIRSQMLGVEGQQAMLMALVGNQARQPKMVHHGNNTNVGDIIVNVESPSADPQLQAEVIAMRVRSALRRKV
jgi:tape measure domain-containing protein